MSVRDRLASLGTALGDFNQGEFRMDSSAIEGVDLTKGYCAGVCLDWTRRVLQSGTGRNASYLNYSTTKRVPTLKRMAKAYGGQGASYVTTTRKADYLAALTQLLTLPESTYDIDGKSVTGVLVPNATAQLIAAKWTLDPDPFDLEMEPAGVVPKSKIQHWLNHAAQQADPQHSKLAAGGREWGQFSKELDNAFAGKKRKFGNIRVVRSSDQQTYGSEGVWLGTLLANAFEPNCCTIIGVGAPGATGHAVAVHVLDTDYRFFDPNYGVYNFTKEKLKNALQHLFWTPFFPDDEGLDPHLPVYRRRETSTEAIDTKPWTQMSYTIFISNV